MRIIYITGNLPYGPGEAFIIAEVRELIRRGHEVIIVPRSPKKGMIQGADLLPMARRESLLSAAVLAASLRLSACAGARAAAAIAPLRRSRNPAVVLKNLAVVPKAFWLADFASRAGADHIHCHWAGTTATLALIASGISGIPWSLTAHRSDIVGDNLLALKARSAAFVRFISESGLKMALRLGLEPGPAMHIIHMGVAIPSDIERRRPTVPVVLCPADLLEVKGHRYLIEAWAALRARGVRGELWLAGGGPLENRLRRLASSLGAEESIRFLGRVRHEDLIRFYEGGAVSAVVLASVDMGGGRHEGIPVALMEAMSFGVPVIATRTGGVPELVIPGAGLLVPPENAIALADAIQAVAAVPRLGETLGKAGRERVIEEFNIAIIAGKLECLFAQATRRGFRGAACAAA